jgi:hypothetical protein
MTAPSVPEPSVTMTETADFSDFMENALDQSSEEPWENMFPISWDQRLEYGTLSKDDEFPIKYSVLLYRGAFNPPHLGNLTVLRSGFEARTGLKVVAAIVVLHSDTYLEGKV